MSTRTEVLLWAKRVCGRRGAEPHELLELSADADLELARNKFHDIARVSHPDLHRTTCSADELEVITNAFAIIAAAYQEFRARRVPTTKMTPLARAKPDTVPPPGTPGAPAAAPAGPAPIAMAPRAIPHFRKAELALKRGDHVAGVLELKLAIAADPTSKFLRTALAEVQAELAKSKPK